MHIKVHILEESKSTKDLYEGSGGDTLVAEGLRCCLNTTHPKTEIIASIPAVVDPRHP